MVDLHCHILPQLDDGPETWDESLAMAAQAAAEGFETVVATPHVTGDSPTMAEIEQRVAELNRRLQERAISLEVVAGAEVGASLDTDLLRHLTLGGSRYLLLEFPHSHLPADAPQRIWKLLAAGLRPIIAHPERNPTVLQEPQRLLELVAAGALAQVTAASVTGALGPDVRRCAHYLLKRGAVHFLATDAHSPGARAPEIRRALRKAARVVGKARAQALVLDHPRAVLAGRILDE